jgi:hypothetical protein
VEKLLIFLLIRGTDLLDIILSIWNPFKDAHFQSVIFPETEKKKKQMKLNQYCALSAGLN